MKAFMIGIAAIGVALALGLQGCESKKDALTITLDQDGRVRSFDNGTARKVELQSYTHDGVTTLTVHWVKNP